MRLTLSAFIFLLCSPLWCIAHTSIHVSPYYIADNGIQVARSGYVLSSYDIVLSGFLAELDAKESDSEFDYISLGVSDVEVLKGSVGLEQEVVIKTEKWLSSELFKSVRQYLAHNENRVINGVEILFSLSECAYSEGICLNHFAIPESEKVKEKLFSKIGRYALEDRSLAYLYHLYDQTPDVEKNRELKDERDQLTFIASGVFELSDVPIQEVVHNGCVKVPFRVEKYLKENSNLSEQSFVESVYLPIYYFEDNRDTASVQKEIDQYEADLKISKTNFIKKKINRQQYDLARESIFTQQKQLRRTIKVKENLTKMLSGGSYWLVATKKPSQVVCSKFTDNSYRFFIRKDKMIPLHYDLINSFK